MKISRIIYTNIRKITTNITKKCNSAINNKSLPIVDTFIQSKKNISNITFFTPLANNKCQPFSPKQYQKADNLKMAKQYAKKVLGIKSYDIDDLELANQVNLTMTRAYNKTKGEIIPHDHVIYTRKIFIDKNKNNYDIEKVPMQNISILSANRIKNILEINKKYFENIDSQIQKVLNSFAKNGQLSKNSKGLDQIELITSFHYDHTLNRYYRLYKQGKLTPKSKVDFQILLEDANENEDYLLIQRKRLSKLLLKQYDINLENLSNEKFKEIATKYLLQLRRTDGKLINNNLLQTKNAMGVDGIVYHELGHNWHSRAVGFKNYTKCCTHYESLDDTLIALKISDYACEEKAETVAELIKGLLSGDKYSEDIMYFGNQLTNGKLQSLI